MNIKPILFNTAMVQALLAGRKTKTRRPVILQDELNPFTVCRNLHKIEYFSGAWGCRQCGAGHINDLQCPLGKVGDLLYVRETCRAHELSDEEAVKYAIEQCDEIPQYGLDGVVFSADSHFVPIKNSIKASEAWGKLNSYRRDFSHTPSIKNNYEIVPGKVVPSIHMPRWASRLTLKIIDIRVERVQDITEESAKDEGAMFTDYGRFCFHGGSILGDGGCPAPDSSHPQRDGWSFKPTTSYKQCLGSARFAFANLWNSLYASWDQNPWCWVVEFEVIHKNVDEVPE